MSVIVFSVSGIVFCVIGVVISAVTYRRTTRLQKTLHDLMQPQAVVVDDRLRGSTGETRVFFTPQTRRSLSVDITNCPHCGSQHASLDLVHNPTFEYGSGHFMVGCPAFGGRKLYCTLTINPSLEEA